MTSHRAIRRMAHEILERNHGLDDLVVVGLQTGGVELAQALAATLEEIEEIEPGPIPASPSARSTSRCTGTTSESVRCCPRRSPTSPSTSTGRP